MNEIPINIQEYFFKVWLEKELLAEFEKWVYDSTELKTVLSSDSYYELISFNYKKDNAHSELKKLIESQVAQSEVEKWKITKDLLNAKNRTDNYSKSIENSVDDSVSKLEKLVSMKEKGLLTDEEFNTMKSKLME
jgi:hypothetical protein